MDTIENNYEGITRDQEDFHPVMSSLNEKRLDRTMRFFLAIADRDITTATTELAATATYHVPGTSFLAGTFAGRDEVVGRFQKLFELTSGSEALKWVDWMVGTNCVSVLVQTFMQTRLSIFNGQHLFLVGFDSSGLIDEIRMFPEDQARIDRFLAQWRD